MKKNDEISTSTSAPAETTENFDAQSQGKTFIFQYHITFFYITFKSFL